MKKHIILVILFRLEICVVKLRWKYNLFGICSKNGCHAYIFCLNHIICGTEMILVYLDLIIWFGRDFLTFLMKQQMIKNIFGVCFRFLRFLVISDTLLFYNKQLDSSRPQPSSWLKFWTFQPSKLLKSCLTFLYLKFFGMKSVLNWYEINGFLSRKVCLVWRNINRPNETLR